MANIKFSAFTQKVAQADVDFLVGYTGADNVRITPAALGDGIYLPLAGGTMTGNVKFNDNIELRLGNGSDLKAYHSGTNTMFDNNTGDLYITNKADDKDIIFRSDDGAGGVETYFYLDGSAGGSDPVTKWPDNSRIQLGTAGDANLYHDGTDTYFYNSTGDLQIINYADDKDIIFASDNGAGGTTAYITLDGSHTTTLIQKKMHFDDNIKLTFGNYATPDLEIYHDGSNSYISDTGTGDLRIWSDNPNISTAAGNKIFYGNNGVAELYYTGAVKKFETTATGIEVTDEVSIGTSIIHTGDTDTKISFGTDEIVLTTAGVDRMTVVSNGNIGIGNNNPNQSGLGIDHTVVTIGTATGMGMMELTGTRTSDADLGRIAWLNAATRRSEIVVSRIDENTSTKMAFSTSNAGSMGTRMTIAKDGDVGIGTTTPLFKLHTYRDDATAIPSVTIEQDGTGDASIHFLLSGIVGWSAGLDNSDGDKFKIHNSQGFSGSFFTIDGSGDVGIGETSVDARLHISSIGGSGISNIKLESGGSSKWAFGIPAGQTYLAFDETNDSLSTPTMVLTKTTKRVGIGDTNPAYLLSLSDSNGADLGFSNSSVLSDGDYLGRIYGIDSSSNFFTGINMFYHDSNDGEIRFRLKTAGTNTDVMTLVDGSVGIGTVAPTAALQVVGLVEYADNAAALLAGLTAGAFYRTGDLLKVVH